MRRWTVPAGYVTGRERDATVVALPSVLADVVSRVREHGSLYAAARAASDAAGDAAFTGRGAAWRLRTPAGVWVVRHYRRGGAAARVLGDRYVRIGTPRPVRELAASEAARARGVRTPLVMAMVMHERALTYQADLATSLVPHSADLADRVFGSAPGDAEAAWHAAGALLRHAFDAGVEHADLNMRNVLIDEEGTGWLLDLDRADVHDHAVSDVARNSMIRRLHRSRLKLERAYGVETPSAALAAFERALQGG